MLNEKKEFQTFNMPWEEDYGYVQAVKNGDTVWIAGQLGHDDKGNLLEGMDNQVAQSYANIAKLLDGFGMKPDDIVEEVLYTLDLPAAFEARKITGSKFYPDAKRVASTIVTVSGLALPGQLIEIKIIAKK